MNVPSGLLESLFENRDGATLTLSTPRARVHIVRFDTNDAGTECTYQLRGDVLPIEHSQRTQSNVTMALAHAIACLEAHAS